MISTLSGDLLSAWHCLDVEERVVLTAGLTTNTHQNRSRILKNIDGSTESYFPHMLPSATISNQTLNEAFILFKRNSCHIRTADRPREKAHPVGGSVLVPVHVECEFQRSSQTPSRNGGVFSLTDKNPEIRKEFAEGRVGKTPRTSLVVFAYQKSAVSSWGNKGSGKWTVTLSEGL